MRHDFNKIVHQMRISRGKDLESKRLKEIMEKEDKLSGERII